MPCGDFAECGSCANAEDEFECDDCDEGSNYVPDEDDGFVEEDVVEHLTYEEFKSLFNKDSALETA